MHARCRSIRAAKVTKRRLLLALICAFTIVTYLALRPILRPVFVLDTDILQHPEVKCNSNFIGYGHEFAILRYARLDKRTHTFAIPCEGDVPRYEFRFGKEGTILKTWLGNISTYAYSEIIAMNTAIDDDNIPTVAVMRYEAHNLYHTMCEWYNVYLLSKLLNFNPKHVRILFMDDRPPSLLDETWRTLFFRVDNTSTLPQQTTVFKTMIWNIIGYESALNFHSTDTPPFLQDFQHFVKSSFSVDTHEQQLNCSSLQVTLILRRDYMTHPERLNDTGGFVHRKFLNENEIIEEIKSMFSGHKIHVKILEKMKMKEQLDLFSVTDLLIGMHGAGMANVMFLPRHAAVLELFPNYWSFLKHFKAFAKWRNIKYIGWQNADPKNEYPNFYTRIPPEILREHLSSLKRYLCPH